MAFPKGKQVIVLALYLLHFSKGLAQDSTAVDSTNRNELNVSFTPGLLFAIGASNTVKSTAWSISYRRYLKNDNVFRIGAEVYPNSKQSAYDGIVFFNRQVDTNYVFSYQYSSITPKTQAFIGFEKLFPRKNSTQGFACDIGVNMQKSSFTRSSYWLPNPSATTQNSLNFYTNGASQTNTNQINNNVDSLAYSYSTKSTGVSLKLLYTVRQELTNNFYLNAAIGPILWLTRNTYYNTSGMLAPRNGYTWLYFDATLFVADVSISYRF